MYETILNAAIPVCSVIIGMVGQHYLSRFARSEDAARDKRLESYASYLASVSKLALINKGDAGAANGAKIALATAKAHIAVYGSNEVVRALAVFEKAPQLSNPKSMIAFVDVIRAMRTDGYVAPVSSNELHWLIFSQDQKLGS